MFSLHISFALAYHLRGGRRRGRKSWRLPSLSLPPLMMKKAVAPVGCPRLGIQEACLASLEWLNWRTENRTGFVFARERKQ